MKLYITLHSPFARMARMMLIEAGLQDRVQQIVAQTRVPCSPYCDINVSGRVPYLIRDDGVGLEESEFICAYLDHVAATSITAVPEGDKGWELRRLTALARSLTDGVSVWFREILRPETERSATIIEHERQRTWRLADAREREIDCALMQGLLNMAQITLACGLGLEAWVTEVAWRDGHPELVSWMDRMNARPSMLETACAEAG